jgi:outer membrane efflux protein
MNKMMKKIIIAVAFMVTSFPLFAQYDMDDMLTSIEENNATLKTLREEVKAQKLGNKTGIYLSNPDVEFNYLWGNPGNIGNRNDFSIKQTFDIPTLSGMKSGVANAKNQMVDLQYKSDRIKILIEAKQLGIDLIYYNALKKELSIRLQHAETIASAYKERLKRGDANQLEYNKVQLNLSTVRGEMSRVDVERGAILSELKRLNGGVDIEFDSSQYGTKSLPANFDGWFVGAEQKNPVLQYVKEQIEVSKKEVKLNKAMGLPSFSTGYMREKTFGQSYQGLSVGISIPLWENKNRVKQARANVLAAEAKQYETKQQFYDQLQTLYMRANGLQQTSAKYRESLTTLNNTELLTKALNAGEISLLNYILEIGLYYETVNQALSAERDYQKAFADLSAVEL